MQPEPPLKVRLRLPAPTSKKIGSGSSGSGSATLVPTVFCICHPWLFLWTHNRIVNWLSVSAGVVQLGPPVPLRSPRRLSMIGRCTVRPQSSSLVSLRPHSLSCWVSFSDWTLYREASELIISQLEATQPLMLGKFQWLDSVPWGLRSHHWPVSMIGWVKLTSVCLSWATVKSSVYR